MVFPNTLLGLRPKATEAQTTEEHHQGRRTKQQEPGARSTKRTEITKWRKLLRHRLDLVGYFRRQAFFQMKFASNHEKGNLIKAKSSNIKLIYGLKLPVKSE